MEFHPQLDKNLTPEDLVNIYSVITKQLLIGKSYQTLAQQQSAHIKKLMSSKDFFRTEMKEDIYSAYRPSRKPQEIRLDTVEKKNSDKGSRAFVPLVISTIKEKESKITEMKLFADKAQWKIQVNDIGVSVEIISAEGVYFIQYDNQEQCQYFLENKPNQKLVFSAENQNYNLLDFFQTSVGKQSYKININNQGNTIQIDLPHPEEKKPTKRLKILSDIDDSKLDALSKEINKTQIHSFFGSKVKTTSNPAIVSLPNIDGKPFISFTNELIKNTEISNDERCMKILTAFINLFTVVNSLHQKDQLHGDISSNNVLVNTSDQTVTLIDFDLMQELKCKYPARSHTNCLNTDLRGLLEIIGEYNHIIKSYPDYNLPSIPYISLNQSIDQSSHLQKLIEELQSKQLEPDLSSETKNIKL